MKNLIICVLFFAVTNFVCGQDNITIRVQENNELHKADNTIKGKYPTIKEESLTIKFRVYSYDKNVKGVIIKNSNPSFIKVNTDNVLKLNDTYGLFNNDNEAKDRNGTKGVVYKYFREFTLQFVATADIKYGTLTVYPIGGGEDIILSYKYEQFKGALKVEKTDKNAYDNVVYLVDSIPKPNEKLVELNKIQFDTIILGKTESERFTVVNNSIDTLSLNYGEKNRFDNYNWGSISPPIDSMPILPLSSQTFTLTLNPKKDSISESDTKDNLQKKVDTLQSNNSVPLDISIKITDGKKIKKTIRIKSIFKAPENKDLSFIDEIINFYNNNVTYLLLVLFLCLLTLIADYKYFQKIVKRPSLEKVTAYVKKQPINLPKKWKNFLDKFKSDKRGENDGVLYVNPLEERVRELESDLAEKTKENENISSKNKELHDTIEQQSHYKKGFEKLSLVTKPEVNTHVEFVEKLSKHEIRTIQDIETVQKARQKALIIDALYTILKNENATIPNTQDESFLSGLQEELSNIIAAYYTAYPSFVKQFSESIHKVNNTLKNSTTQKATTESIFIKILDTVLHGKTGKRGLTLAYDICADDSVDGALAKRLELSNKKEFQNLKQKTFYQKFIASFKLEINTLSILYAYSRVEIIKVKMQQEGIDIEKLQAAYNSMNQALQNLGITILIPQLFEDSFDAEVHEMAQDSTLIYHFKSAIEALPSKVIYDIEKIAFETNFEGVQERENLPRVLYRA